MDVFLSMRVKNVFKSTNSLHYAVFFIIVDAKTNIVPKGNYCKFLIHSIKSLKPLFLQHPLQKGFFFKFPFYSNLPHGRDQFVTDHRARRCVCLQHLPFSQPGVRTVNFHKDNKVCLVGTWSFWSHSWSDLSLKRDEELKGWGACSKGDTTWQGLMWRRWWRVLLDEG